MYRPASGQVFAVDAEYISQNLRGQRIRGVPVNTAGDYLTATTWSANEPSDRIKMVGRVLQARANNELPHQWQTSALFRYLGYENYDKYHEPRGLNAATAAGRTMRRQYRDYYRANDDWSLTANAIRAARTGAIQHRLLFGFEQYNQNQGFRFATAREVEAGGTVPPLDLYRPAYGAANPATYRLGAYNNYTAHTRRSGFYGQDEVTLGRHFGVLLSGRLDRYHDNGYADAPLEYRDVVPAGRVGITYKPTNTLTFYANGANSVTRAPIYAQTPSANGPFAPERGHQFEVGAKTDVLQRKLSFTTAYFRIDKTNILRPDPALGPSGNNSNAVLVTGAARSEGIEFNAEGFLGRSLYLTTNYAYLNTRIVRDNTVAVLGQRLPNAPRHTVGLFARYNVLRQTGIGLGLEGVTNRVEPYAGIRAGGYFIADVSVYQDISSRVHLQLQATNVANSTYTTASLFAARVGNMPGQPRAIIFTISTNPFRR